MKCIQSIACTIKTIDILKLCEKSLSFLFSQNDIHQDGKDGVTVAKTPAKRERSGSSGPCSTTSSTNHWLSAYSEAQITPRKITSELI